MINTRDLDINDDGTVRDSQAGSILIVEAISAGTLAIQFLDAGGQIRGRVTGVTVGRKYRPGFKFGGYILTGTAGAAVRLIVGDGDADTFLSTITATIANEQLSTQEQLAQALTNVAAVAVTAAATALLAADVSRRVSYFRNDGAETIAIGGAGLTYAGAAIRLLPGDVWVEDKSPGAAWFGICDAGLASTMNILKGA